MFLVDVHEFDVVFTNPILIWALKDEIDHIRGIFSLQCENICRLGGSQDFHEGRKVDSESNVAVAAEWRKCFGLQHHGYECDVRVVHGLEGDTRVIAIKVAVLDKILN